MSSLNLVLTTNTGDMTNDGANAMTYDAENRAVSAAGASYTYDGNSLRVKKISGGTTTVYIFSGTKVIAEYSGTSAPYPRAREYIYSGSQLLATIESGATKYHHTDHLSVRLTTDATGTKIGDQGHFPYGEVWYASNSTTKWQFTTYERDSESGNDYALLRCGVNRLGRFSSPDLVAGTVADPQSLNRYAYVLNDPANLVDPLGLCPQSDGSLTSYTDAKGNQIGAAVVFVCADSLQLNTGGLDRFSFPVLIYAGGPKSGSGGAGAAAFLALKTGANTLTNPKNLNSEECQKDLAKLGITADQLRAAASAVNFINGVGSTVPLSSLYATSPVPGVRQAGRSAQGTVGEKLAQPGTVAVAQLGGHDIYVNPRLVNPLNYRENLGTAFHETVHNVTGLTDPDIQRALGIKEQDITHNITEKLLKDCF